MTITKRSIKGSPLTNAEIDGNVDHLLNADAAIISTADALATTVSGKFAYLGPVAWASRPSAVTSGAGAQLLVNNIGTAPRTVFVSDGTNWLPLGGRLLIKGASSTIAAPLNNITGNGATAVLFAIPGGSPAILAGMLIPLRTRIEIRYQARKHGTAGTWDIQSRLGSTNSATDNGVYNQTGLTNASNQDFRQQAECHVVSSTSFFTQNGLSIGGQGAGNAVERTTNFDISVTNYVTFSVTNVNAADTVDLLNYSVELVYY